MPLESATAAALRGGEQFVGWDRHLYMLANIVDAIQENTYAFVSANSKKKPKAPVRIERPAAKAKAAKNAAANKFAAMARIAYAKGKKNQKGR